MPKEEVTVMHFAYYRATAAAGALALREVFRGD